MTPEQFIKDNPFPPDGPKINTDLVKSLQDPNKKQFYKKNLYKLFKNNAGLIYIVYRQYNYNQSLASIMSFVYEGLETAAGNYKMGSNKPFYSYALTVIRGLLQKYYNYNEGLIHIPVMKKKTFTVEKTEINDTTESSRYVYAESNDPLIDELDMLLVEYEYQTLNPKQQRELEIIKLYKTMGIKEIAETLDLSVAKVRNIIKRTIPKLQSFYKKSFV